MDSLSCSQALFFACVDGEQFAFRIDLLMRRNSFTSILRPRLLLLGSIAVLLGASLSSCSNDVAAPRIIQVPSDQPTIQDAVNAAQSGDLVLIDKGVYSEGVTVENDGITIRGMDRNAVVLDGRGKFSNGFTVTGNGVTIQNLTLHSYQQNAIIFTGVLPTSSEDDESYEYAGDSAGKVVDGYRVDHVTTFNNGLYGIYAFASRNGVIENSYASGHPDSGIYVGQCRPCNAVLQNNVSENNAIGYYGTNASGNVFVVNSIFRKNRLGIAPNSQDAEKLSPQSSTVVAGNIVDDNDNPDAPKIPEGFFAAGIAVGGGTENTVTKNKVTNHSGAGIVLLTLNQYEPQGNVISENFLLNNGTDLVYTSRTDLGNKNCFERNRYKSSSPSNIEKIMKCGRESNVPSTSFLFPVAPLGPNFQDVVKPGEQPNMRNPKTAKWSPVVGEPSYPNIDSIALPK